MIPGIPCESVPGHADFRPLGSLPRVRVDLRYATPNNFVGRDLYSPLDCAWLHRVAAEGLESSARWLDAHMDGVGLLVLDALRPQRVQEQLWNALAGTDLQMYLADPERGSIHSFGMAVDVTLIDRHGAELDMGTPFDDLTELSHPAKEQAFLAVGTLSRQQVENRQLLRDAMTQGGFRGINSEWWHYDCGDRIAVRATFARVL